LDILEPPPTPVLLSAEDAKEKLRELIEGFFFWRLRGKDGKHIRRLLVKSPLRGSSATCGKPASPAGKTTPKAAETGLTLDPKSEAVRRFCEW
jgi:hypothetical protein